MGRMRAGGVIVAGFVALGTVGGCQAMPTTTAMRVLEQAPIQQNLSFDLFGIHKAYPQVTAEVGKDANGQPQTTIRAVEGENALTMVVQGEGVGEHPVQSVTIKDSHLGGTERHFEAGDPKLSGTVTFTDFDLATGKIAGTFTAAYKGFPPISVSNGQVTALATQPVQTAGTP